MCPILSATHTYNYALAKWLDEKLKPLSCNHYTVTDTFEFVNEVQNLEINRGDILVSYDVTSLFTNVPLHENENEVTPEVSGLYYFGGHYNMSILKRTFRKKL